MRSKQIRKQRRLLTNGNLQLIILCFFALVLVFLWSFQSSFTESLPGFTTLLRKQRHVVQTVTREDLVISIPSDEEHAPLIQASWLWRKGLRTVVAVNDTDLAEAFNQVADAWQEKWVHWPDDEPLRGNYRGDTRAALVPFLAHQTLGDSYKWILYGDDDTLWFVDNVLDLVKDFDHNLPYFITDNIWWSSVNNTIGSQPNLEAPRCLPCNYSTYGAKPEGNMRFDAPEGCPCTPQLLCAASHRQQFDLDCDIPLHLVPAFSTRTYSMHGGAGGLMSVGLLRSVSIREMEDCIVQHGHSTGGDAFITICLWKLGFAHTDPGPYFNLESMRLFDAAATMNSQHLADRLFEAAEESCDHPICPELIDKMVSSHIHSRKAGSIEQAAETITRLSQAYLAYTDSKKF